MVSNLTDHLEFLFKNDSGYVYSPVKKADGNWVPRFFNWPLEATALADYLVTESASSDVYLSPVIYKEKRIANDAISHSNVVWIEFDGKRELKWTEIPEPDAIIQTSSSTHLHCFWRTDQLNVETLEDINRRLTYYLEADSSGWDAVQVLRVPDTMNYKHNITTKLIKLKAQIHPVSDFDKAPVLEKAPEVFTFDNILEVDTVLRTNTLSPALMKQVKSEIVLHPYRSEFLMKMGYELAEAGLDPLEIVSCLYYIDCRIKKFVGRSDQLKRLSEIASRATFKAEQDTYLSVYSPADILSHTNNLEWIIPGWLHNTGFMIVSGQPGVGKTQFCFDFSYRLATGKVILGKEISRPYKVLFFSLEMDVPELQYIFKHQSKEFLETALWNTNLSIVSPDWDSGMQSFEKTLQEINPDILIIDSISELATDDLKESEAREILRWIKKIRKANNVAVIAIHHNRKASDGNKKPRKLSDLYGSYLFAKSTDTVLSLWQEEGRELLDMDSLKTRFGKDVSFKLRRSENLVFERGEIEVASSESTGPTETKISLNFR